MTEEQVECAESFSLWCMQQGHRVDSCEASPTSNGLSVQYTQQDGTQIRQTTSIFPISGSIYVDHQERLLPGATEWQSFK